MKAMRFLSMTLLLGAVIIAGFASNAMALTQACTNISNQATLSYTVGGGPVINLDSDSDTGTAGQQSTDFVVDTLIDLTVAVTNSPVTATGTDNVMRFTVTNNGNDDQDYELVLYNAATTETYNSGTLTTDTFDMENIRVFYDTTPDGNYDGDETPLAFTGSGSSLGEVAGVAYNGAVFEVFVVADVPVAEATGAIAAYGLEVITHQNGGNAGASGVADSRSGLPGGGSGAAGTDCDASGGDLVLGDGSGDTTTPNTIAALSDVAGNGAQYAIGHYVVSAANIAVTKNYEVLWDPVNLGVGTQYAIPGAYIRYNVAVLNSGTAAANLTTISDTLVGQLAYDTDFVTSAGPGNPESAGNGFLVTNNSGRATTITGTDYYTPLGADGVLHDGSATGGTITATYTTLLPAEDGYTAGELRQNEEVKLFFNAIIQ